MPITVAKFGGTSLCSAEQFRRVRSIVLADSSRRFVVPSAPGKRAATDCKITDLLYRCHSHVQSGVSFGDVFGLIARRYQEIVADLGLDLAIDLHLQQVFRHIGEGAGADYAASRGEYLNGLILARLLDYDFVDAADVIRFRQDGLLDLDTTQSLIGKIVGKHAYAVIPGFYGSLADGTIKTFSRGGSDVTGATIARGVAADRYENWTDVPGFLMADPRIVRNPRPIRLVTYSELRELAYMGANVLHEEAIFPVRIAGIPIHIRDTYHPDHPGTVIAKTVDPQQRTHVITGIAGRKDFTIISIEKALMNYELGFVRKLLSILEAQHISFEHIPSGIDHVSLVILHNELDGKLAGVLQEIEAQLHPDKVDVITDIALIATVGQGMAYTPGIAAKLFSSLANDGINIRMIDQGSSEINILVGVEVSDFERAIQSIYRAFVNGCSDENG